jgi:hypothetical protein
MPELTITSPYVPSRVRVDYNTFTTGNPMPEGTLDLASVTGNLFSHLLLIT